MTSTDYIAIAPRRSSATSKAEPDQPSLVIPFGADLVRERSLDVCNSPPCGIGELLERHGLAVRQQTDRVREQLPPLHPAPDVPPHHDGRPHGLRLVRGRRAHVPSDPRCPGTIESTCPETGRTIRIELTPDEVSSVDPLDAVVSAIRPPRRADRPTFSELPTRALLQLAGQRRQLAGDQHPGGEVYPVHEAFRMDRQVIKQLGWNMPGSGG